MTESASPTPAAVAEAVLAAWPALLASSSRLVIGFAGESGSGKTETARAVAAALTQAGRPAALLHQDDYFRRPPATNHAYREADLAHVGPQEVDLPRLEALLAAFRRGDDEVAGQVVDYAHDCFRPCVLHFGATAVLCLEGTYVLSLAGLDCRVFLAATHEETRARREARARAASELTPFVTRVLALEHAIIRQQRAIADVVIDAAFRVSMAPRP